MDRSTRQYKARKKVKKSPKGRVLVDVYRRTKKLFKANIIAIISLIISVVVSYFIFRLSSDLPDIRCVAYSTTKDTTEMYEGKIMWFITTKNRYKNFSFKSGYIDRVEYTPTSLDTLPEVKVAYIDKQQIGWREEKEIEIRSIMTVSLSSYSKALLKGNRYLELEERLYDNTGKLVSTAFDGSSTPTKVGVWIGNKMPDDYPKDKPLIKIP